VGIKPPDDKTLNKSVKNPDKSPLREKEVTNPPDQTDGAPLSIPPHTEPRIDDDVKPLWKHPAIIVAYVSFTGLGIAGIRYLFKRNYRTKIIAGKQSSSTSVSSPSQSAQDEEFFSTLSQLIKADETKLRGGGRGHSDKMAEAVAKASAVELTPCRTGSVFYPQPYRMREDLVVDKSRLS